MNAATDAMLVYTIGAQGLGAARWPANMKDKWGGRTQLKSVYPCISKELVMGDGG